MPKEPKGPKTETSSEDVPSGERFTVTPLPAVPEQAWGEIAQISKNLTGLVRATNNQAQYVRQIPELKKEIRDARDVAGRANQAIEVVSAKLTTEFKNLDRRVGKMEDRPHDCAQVPTITELRETTLEVRRKVEDDMREGVETRERLTSTRGELGELDERVKAFGTARRGLWMGLLGLVAFGLTTVGSLVWFLSETSTKVQAEQYERREGYKRLEKQIAEVAEVADVEPVRQEIETLTKVVGNEGEQAATDRLCEDLSNRAVMVLKRSLPRSDWPKCQRFRRRGR